MQDFSSESGLELKIQLCVAKLHLLILYQGTSPAHVFGAPSALNREYDTSGTKQIAYGILGPESPTMAFFQNWKL